MTGDSLEQLRAALPQGCLSTGPADLGANTFDRSGWIPDGSGPIGVVFARDASDVQATMRFASAHGVQVAWDAAGEIFALALRLGGTLTGEHGVGVLKRAWVERELGSDNVALQKRLLVLFDPAAILNPGKVF